MNSKDIIKEIVKVIPGVSTIRSFQSAFSAPMKTIIDSRKKVKKYRDKYKGMRCFIVGNGPSLVPSDLDLIKNEISFAANTIFKMYSKTAWRPTYYCIQDENVLKEIADEVSTEIEATSEATFIRMRSSRIVMKEKLKFNNLIYIPIVWKKTKRYSAPFSKDASKYVFDGSMVTYLALQLAVYMGFSEVYLLGMDHNFPYSYNREGKIIANDVNIAVHFWESADENKDQGRIILHANYQEFAENSYREAKEFCEKDGSVTIYNATRGGKLEVFERVNLDEIVNAGDKC